MVGNGSSLRILALATSIFSVDAHGRLTYPMTRKGDTGYENAPVLFNEQFVCRHPQPNPQVTRPTIVAGKITQVQWDFSAAHVGDCALYISYDVNVPDTSARFVKIANFPDCRSQDGQRVSVVIPSVLPAGDAILRWDWYATQHLPSVEWYDQCADVHISSASARTWDSFNSFRILNDPPMYPPDSNTAPSFWNPYGSDPFYMTGPACVDGSINRCNLTEPGTRGHTVGGEGVASTQPTPAPRAPAAPSGPPTLAPAPTAPAPSVPTAAPATPGPTRPATAAPAPPTLAPGPAGVLPPTSDAVVDRVMGALRSAKSDGVFAYETAERSWEPSDLYTWGDMTAAVRKMATVGVGQLKLWLGGDDYRYGLVNVAAFLAQVMQETIRYNACDENNWSDAATMSGEGATYPATAACGQLHQSYQNYQCTAEENALAGGNMACDADPNMEARAFTRAHWYGSPPEMFCAPKSKVPKAPRWDTAHVCSSEEQSQYKHMDLQEYFDYVSNGGKCGDYDHEKAGGWTFDGDLCSEAGCANMAAPLFDTPARTDVEGCCWWGRGAIQTSGVCNFGKLNFYLGKRAASEGRDALYPEIDFCRSPGSICDPEGPPELKWVAGFFYWLNSVQPYSSGGWSYSDRLRAWVDGGMSRADNDFIDGASGIVNRGCPHADCGTGPLDARDNRRKNFYAVLDALSLEPGPLAPRSPTPPPSPAWAGLTPPTPPPAPIAPGPAAQQPTVQPAPAPAAATPKPAPATHSAVLGVVLAGLGVVVAALVGSRLVRRGLCGRRSAKPGPGLGVDNFVAASADRKTPTDRADPQDDPEFGANPLEAAASWIEEQRKTAASWMERARAEGPSWAAMVWGVFDERPENDEPSLHRPGAPSQSVVI